MQTIRKNNQSLEKLELQSIDIVKILNISDLLFLFSSSILLILFGSLLTIKNQINFAFAKIFSIVIIYIWLLFLVIKSNQTFDININLNFENILIFFSINFFLILTAYLSKKQVQSTFELPLIFLMAILGMIVIIRSTDLFTIFLGIELSSFSSYTLAAYRTNRSYLQTEAGLKYFLFGSVASSLYLFGISIFYLIFGTIEWESIVALSLFPLENQLIFNIGLALIFVSLFFKLGVAPFHFWLPLVYSYSASLVTYMFILLPKIPLLYLLLQFSNLNFSFLFYLPLLASLFFGTIFAFKATNFKNFLAYSSIANSAFFLAPLIYQSVFSIFSLLFYIFSYNILITIAFLPILFLRRADNSQALSNLRDMIILKKTNPLLAIFFSLMALSFAGVPPLLGFFSKLVILLSSLSFSAYFLTGVLLAFSLISSYYYLRLLKVIYFPFTLKYALITSVPTIPALIISAFSIINIFFICFPTYIGIFII